VGTPRDMNELINGSENGALPFIGAAQRLLRMSKVLPGLQTALGQWVTETSGEELCKRRLWKGASLSIGAPSGNMEGGSFTADLHVER
jgi:hypothetical protein